MRHKITTFLILLSFISFAQKENVKWLDIRLSNYEYPFPVQFIQLDVQQQHLEMAYMDIQPDNYNGKNVMLLHGKNFNGAYWETTANALLKKGYRVIIPDQIGFGKSSKPAYFQYTFQQLAANTRQLLDSLGVSETTILGHSMGGMLATRFALMFPEITAKLALVNPIGLEDWKLKAPYKSIDWWYEQELSKTYDDIKSYQKSSYYDGNWKPEYNPWVNLLAGWTLNSDYPTIARNAALTYDMIFTQPVVYEFEKLEVPTLLIIGTRDRTALGKSLVSEEVRKTMGLYDQLGKETHRKIPDSKLVELDDIGHLPHIESFDRFIHPLLDFLN
jgi:pimeloyl-ACP methyl ester carboxylesterase